ncbi:hypothetical protein EDEG_00326 [Edhazardia aedis USNM 41457]|uniref:Uncharacterized protein n=1 Tax=Edhazardia aedis (strain USNM 41457) TaxID=1003232 RepID=J9DHA1_EDHAE|nr:hypothetical protein EDEG_00326 [Edhazardia aedis USNM 41457]|eukprot:EJW01980.1 hypothetical protein EDEG_00326 [Edhazardia aedis USNM 41457]
MEVTVFRSEAEINYYNKGASIYSNIMAISHNDHFISLRLLPTFELLSTYYFKEKILMVHFIDESHMVIALDVQSKITRLVVFDIQSLTQKVFFDESVVVFVYFFESIIYLCDNRNLVYTAKFKGLKKHFSRENKGFFFKLKGYDAYEKNLIINSAGLTYNKIINSTNNTSNGEKVSKKETIKDLDTDIKIKTNTVNYTNLEESKLHQKMNILKGFKHLKKSAEFEASENSVNKALVNFDSTFDMSSCDILIESRNKFVCLDVVKNNLIFMDERGFLVCFNGKNKLNEFHIENQQFSSIKHFTDSIFVASTYNGMLYLVDIQQERILDQIHARESAINLMIIFERKIFVTGIDSRISSFSVLKNKLSKSHQSEIHHEQIHIFLPYMNRLFSVSNHCLGVLIHSLNSLETHKIYLDDLHKQNNGFFVKNEINYLNIYFKNLSLPTKIIHNDNNIHKSAETHSETNICLKETQKGDLNVLNTIDFKNNKYIGNIFNLNDKSNSHYKLEHLFKNNDKLSFPNISNNLRIHQYVSYIILNSSKPILTFAIDSELRYIAFSTIESTIIYKRDNKDFSIAENLEPSIKQYIECNNIFIVSYTNILKCFSLQTRKFIFEKKLNALETIQTCKPNYCLLKRTKILLSTNGDEYKINIDGELCDFIAISGNFYFLVYVEEPDSLESSTKNLKEKFTSKNLFGYFKIFLYDIFSESSEILFEMSGSYCVHQLVHDNDKIFLSDTSRIFSLNLKTHEIKKTYIGPIIRSISVSDGNLCISHSSDKEILDQSSDRKQQIRWRNKIKI